MRRKHVSVAYLRNLAGSSNTCFLVPVLRTSYVFILESNCLKTELSLETRSSSLTGGVKGVSQTIV